jgi:hypothetical protein
MVHAIAPIFDFRDYSFPIFIPIRIACDRIKRAVIALVRAKWNMNVNIVRLHVLQLKGRNSQAQRKPSLRGRAAPTRIILLSLA